MVPHCCQLCVNQNVVGAVKQAMLVNDSSWSAKRVGGATRRDDYGCAAVAGCNAAARGRTPSTCTSRASIPPSMGSSADCIWPLRCAARVSSMHRALPRREAVCRQAGSSTLWFMTATRQPLKQAQQQQ